MGTPVKTNQNLRPKNPSGFPGVTVRDESQIFDTAETKKNPAGSLEPKASADLKSVLVPSV